MAARSKARKRALDVLFEAEQRGLSVGQLLDLRLVDSGAETPLPEYAVEIVRGVLEHWADIATAITGALQEWTLERLPAVDRAILRVAVWEVLYNHEVAPAVAIDEAVDLATRLSTDASAAFINGVLGTITSTAAPTEVKPHAVEAGESPVG